MLATSVAVVTKMLEAVAGSAPRRFRPSGTSAPENAADRATADHRETDHDAEHQRVGRLLRERKQVHRDAAQHSGHRAIGEAEEAFP
jgi:hypothetical protein